MMKRWYILYTGLLLMTLVLSAFAQHEDDIQPGYENTTLAVIEPHELAEPPYTLKFTLEELLPGLYGVDVGWILYVEHGASHPQLQRVTVEQLFISNGLYAVVEGQTDPVFGQGAPGRFTFTHPGTSHLHMVFASNILPTRHDPLIFRFRLTDGIAHNGTVLNDSREYTLTFVPEPASLSVLMVGLGVFAFRRRKEVNR